MLLARIRTSRSWNVLATRSYKYQAGSALSTDTGSNIANAISEINNENAFKFLRDSSTPHHDMFNIENYEKKIPATEETESDALKRRAYESAAKLADSKVMVDSFFNSNTMVEELKKGGFTDPQADIIMSVAREALLHRLNWVQSELAPKVDMENEEYLFQAAHNELLVEVTNEREIALMNLQNSSVILKRKFNNLEDETSTKIKLNGDTITMELSQFKHENNLQQRELEIKNTDLKNRIVSELMSGLRSNIEQFRWQLTRSGIFAIMLMAGSIIGGWGLIQSKKDAAEEEEKPKPQLVASNGPADEESHDYEADWDETVEIPTRQ